MSNAANSEESMQAIEILGRHQPCKDAVDWVGTRTPRQAWQQCKRGDWLLWAVAKLSIDRSTLALATCECVKLSWQFCDGAALLQSMLTIHIVEEWVEGHVDIETVRAAADAAADAAVASAAYIAVYAAVYAADAAVASAVASAAAEAVADAAASAYATHAVKQDTQLDCARIVRRLIPWVRVATLIKAMGPCHE